MLVDAGGWMHAPVVAIIGVGVAGEAAASFSIRESLRQARYLSIIPRDALATSSDVIHRLGVDGPQSIADLTRLDRPLWHTLSDVDTCILLVSGADQTARICAPAIAALAARLGCLTIGVATFPYRVAGRLAAGNAAMALLRLRRHCDYLFPFPLDRLTAMAGSRLGPSRADELLHQHIDDLIGLLAATPVNGRPFPRRRRAGLPCSIASYRRHLSELGGSSDEVARTVLADPFLITDFVREAERVSILYSDDGALPLTHVQAVAGAIASISPAPIDFADFPGAIPSSVETLSFGRVPSRFFSLAMRPDIVIGDEMVARYWSWKTVSPTLELGTFPVVSPAAAVLSGVPLLLTPPALAAPFPPGGVLDRLDQLATRVEALARSVRARLKRPSVTPGPTARRPTLAVSPHALLEKAKRTSRVDLAVAAIIALLMLAPIGLKTLGLATLASISRAVSLERLGSSYTAVPDLKKADQAAFDRAAASLGIDPNGFAGQGLAASAPAILTAHLDRDAVEQSYFSLAGFQGNASPFDYVSSHGPAAAGQISHILQNLQPSSDSPVKALYTLGISSSPEKLSLITGRSPDAVAIEIWGIYHPDDTTDDGSKDWLLGCGTAWSTLTSYLNLKRLAPQGIALPDRYYATYLSQISGGSCMSRQKQSAAAMKTLAAYGKAEITRSDVHGPNSSYKVIVPKSLNAGPSNATATATPLGQYQTGLEHFYLLDFAGARTVFGHMAQGTDPTVSALGHFLEVRAAYWNDRLLYGDYRPDKSPPSNGLSGLAGVDDTDTDDDDDGKKVGYTAENALPCKAANEDAACLLATYHQKSLGGAPTLDAALVTSARQALERMPVIDETLLAAGLGTTGKTSR
jgi:hypothetical protein